MKNRYDSFPLEEDKDELTLLDKIEYDTSYQGTVLQELMKEAQKYPILSADTQKELAVRAQKGDKDAQDALVNHNIKLILSRAYRFWHKNPTLDVMDLFQEGSTGIIKALNNYDYTVSSFSTYAISWVDQAIERAITNTKDIIRIPVHLHDKLNKYRAILNETKQYGLPELSDREICEQLEISQATLNNMKEAIKSVPISLDEKVKDDSETDRSNFVPYYENGFELTENNMVQNEMFSLINSLLKPHEFYIIYYRILCDEQLTLEELGDCFNITRERVRQIEAKALRKIKPYFESNEIAVKMVANKKNESSLYKTKPISIDKIILYQFLKDHGFDSYQRYIFYELYLSPTIHTRETICKELNISLEDYDLLKKSMLEKMHQILSHKSFFLEYRKKLLGEYGTRIFTLVKKPEILHDDTLLAKIKKEEKERIKAEEKKKKPRKKYVRKIENYSRAQNIDEVLDLSFEDFCQTYDISSIRPKHLKMLESFFTYPIQSDKKVDPADIYMQILGYNGFTIDVEPKILYQTYRNHVLDFTEEQQFFLEAFVFHKKAPEEFLKKYPKSTCKSQLSHLYSRLEAYHYNVNCFKDNSFTKEKWLQVKKTHPELFTKERITYLDMYYGVNQKPVTISAMAKRFKMKMSHMNDLVSDARNRAINVYNNRFNTLDIDDSLYIPLLRDYRISFIPRTREILILFLEEKKSYKDIAEIYGISTVQVSNIITDALRKLDNIRYGITAYTGMDLDDIEKFFSESDYTEIDKSIIRDRKVNDMPIEEACKKYGLDRITINRKITKFNKHYETFICKDVEITTEDILREINKEPYESILSQDEKNVIAYAFGVQCKYNRKGEKLSYAEIGEKFHMNRVDTYQMYYRICKKIKLIKLGYLKHDLITIPRDVIIEALKDERLPISDKEKDIIKRIYGLTAIHETPEEIAMSYGEMPNSIIRRYQRALVTLLKYKEGVIEGKIIFEKDVVPILKYFSKFDKMVVTDMYRDNLTINEMEKKYGLTNAQTVILRKRIEPVFLEILHNPNGQYFDFDYYDEVVDNPDIPYQGNKKLVKEMFDLYTGNTGKIPMSIPQIIDYLNLDFTTNSSISKAMTALMIGVCKYRDGIKLKYLPLFEEVRTYYDSNKDKMSKEELSAFLAYFKTHKKNVILENVTVPDKRLVYLFLKEKYPDLYDPDTFTKAEVIDLIKKHGDSLDDDIISGLKNEYGIMNRELLSTEEYEKMRKLIVSIINKKVKCQTLELQSE